MKSLINIIPRKNAAGEIYYYQARFFGKGCKEETLSLPREIKSRSEAYLKAREMAEEVLFPAMTKEEINNYGLLTVEEVKAVLALPDDKLEEARNILIVLLGITCGLGVSEIRHLERKQITQNDTLAIGAGDKSRVIPFIGKVRDRFEKMKTHFPDSLFVIPNFRHSDKPCNPSSIKRGVEAVLAGIGVGKERNIVPSVLWETFVSLLVSSKPDIDMRTVDYLLGFHTFTEILLSKEIPQAIEAISSMMMRLENMHHRPNMNWYLQLKETGL
jgi:integrase